MQNIYVRTGIAANIRWYFFHDHTESARDYSAMLPYAAASYSDCRGSEDIGGVRGYTYHGHFIRSLTETDPERLLYRSVVLDAVQLVHIVQMEGFDLGRMIDTSRAARDRLCRKLN